VIIQQETIEADARIVTLVYDGTFYYLNEHNFWSDPGVGHQLYPDHWLRVSVAQAIMWGFPKNELLGLDRGEWLVMRLYIEEETEQDINLTLDDLVDVFTTKEEE
jgi:hypothetical protein